MTLVERLGLLDDPARFEYEFCHWIEQGAWGGCGTRLEEAVFPESLVHLVSLDISVLPERYAHLDAGMVLRRTPPTTRALAALLAAFASACPLHDLHDVCARGEAEGASSPREWAFAECCEAYAALGEEDWCGAGVRNSSGFAALDAWGEDGAYGAYRVAGACEAPLPRCFVDADREATIVHLTKLIDWGAPYDEDAALWDREISSITDEAIEYWQPHIGAYIGRDEFVEYAYTLNPEFNFDAFLHSPIEIVHLERGEGGDDWVLNYKWKTAAGFDGETLEGADYEDVRLALGFAGGVSDAYKLNYTEFSRPTYAFMSRIGMAPATLCAGALHYCPEGLFPYDSVEACVDFLSEDVPKTCLEGSGGYFSGDTLACRQMHLQLALLNPIVHCQHLGPDSDKCDAAPRNGTRVVAYCSATSGRYGADGVLRRRGILLGVGIFLLAAVVLAAVALAKGARRWRRFMAPDPDCVGLDARRHSLYLVSLSSIADEPTCTDATRPFLPAFPPAMPTFNPALVLSPTAWFETTKGAGTALVRGVGHVVEGTVDAGKTVLREANAAGTALVREDTASRSVAMLKSPQKRRFALGDVDVGRLRRGAGAFADGEHSQRTLDGDDSVFEEGLDESATDPTPERPRFSLRGKSIRSGEWGDGSLKSVVSLKTEASDDAPRITPESPEATELPTRRIGIAFRDLDVTAVASPCGRGGAPKRLLRGLHGSVAPGTMTALVGPSGSGKTTLLSVLSGQEKAYGYEAAGRLECREFPADGGPSVRVPRSWAAERAQLSTLARELPLFDALTLGEQLRYYALTIPSLSAPKWARLERADDVAREAGLRSYYGTRVDKLSEGTHRRLLVAIRLLALPSILALDELTSGQDAATALSLVRGAAQLAERGLTVLVVIHQPSAEVFALFDTVVALRPKGDGCDVTTPTAVAHAVERLKRRSRPGGRLANPADMLLDARDALVDRATGGALALDEPPDFGPLDDDDDDVARVLAERRDEPWFQPERAAALHLATFYRAGGAAQLIGYVLTALCLAAVLSLFNPRAKDGTTLTSARDGGDVVFVLFVGLTTLCGVSNFQANCVVVPLERTRFERNAASRYETARAHVIFATLRDALVVSVGATLYFVAAFFGAAVAPANRLGPCLVVFVAAQHAFHATGALFFHLGAVGDPTAGIVLSGVYNFVVFLVSGVVVKVQDMAPFWRGVAVVLPGYSAMGLLSLFAFKDRAFDCDDRAYPEECYDGDAVLAIFGFQTFQDRVALSLATLLLNYAAARLALFALLRRAANRGKRRVAPLDGPRAPEAEAVALLKPPDGPS